MKKKRKATGASRSVSHARPAERPRVARLTWLLATVTLLVSITYGVVTGLRAAPDGRQTTSVLLSLVVALPIGLAICANIFAADALRWPRRREFGVVLFGYELTAVALAWVFPPHGVWPLAFVALVPWTVLTCRASRAWVVHWLSFFVGWGFFLVSLRWLSHTTGLGYSALAMYLAIYWTLAAWAIRTARRHGISPVWSLPVVWVACEYLRATVMSGFPWLFVSHAFYAQLPLIQISDMTGAYGVTFLALLVNGVLVELILWRWPVPGTRRTLRPLVAGAATSVVLLVATLWYGYYRLGQVDFEDDARGGPLVAVVQEDFPLVSTPPYTTTPDREVFVSYMKNGAVAATTGQPPDLVAFPETAWNAIQNREYLENQPTIPEARPYRWRFSTYCHEALAAFARGDYPSVNAVISRMESAPDELPRLPAQGGPPVTALVGAMSVEETGLIYPKARIYNSALLYGRDGHQYKVRYDKNHLVPFGEFVPFRQAKFLGLDLHWLYRWLNSLSPFSGGTGAEYSLTHGRQFTIFRLKHGPRATGDAVPPSKEIPFFKRVLYRDNQNRRRALWRDLTRALPLPAAAAAFDACESALDRELGEPVPYRFGVPICYEDVMPYVIRRFVWAGGRRRADFLVNISNDGWFLYSNELPQHLAICAFRAVENRIGIARAVNTGVSGFIDPDGRIHDCVTDARGRRHGKGIAGYARARVHLDWRSSVYGRYGDVFAGICLLLTAVLWLSAVFERWILAIRQHVIGWLGKGGK